MTTKTAFIIIRVTSETKKNAEKKAKRLKMTLSQWGRNVLEDDLVD